jgi:hypothetical protein
MQTVRLYSDQAAQLASGIGFYSWNEMVDTHVAFASGSDIDATWTRERSERAIGLMAATVARYRSNVGMAAPALMWSAPKLENGRFQATLHGTPGASYLVEQSSDLMIWSVLRSLNIASSGVTELSQSVQTTAVFLRARTQ